MGRKFVFARGVDLVGELCDDRRFTKALAPGVEDLRMFVADGLFTAETDEPNWRLAHDLLMPAFSKSAMRGYHEVMVAATDELISVWDGAAGEGRTVDVSPWLTKLTLETIGRAAFSHTFGSFETAEVDPFVTTFVGDMSHAASRSNLAALPLAFAPGRQFLYSLSTDVLGARPSSDTQRRVLPNGTTRTLLAAPPILLLDESTSSLDGLNEQMLREAIDAVAENRTLIVIAHRLSTVVDSDTIVVLEHGRVVGTGTHSELVKSTPLYRDLAKHQLLV